MIVATASVSAAENEVEENARLEGSGAAGLADVVRALDREEVRVANLRLDEPSLDDVFLAKTGRSLEGAGEDEEREMDGVHA